MKARSYRCANCGKRLKTDQWIYSRWTGTRYCTELDACMKRAKSKKRKTTAVAV